MKIKYLEFNAFGPYPNKIDIDFEKINEKRIFLVTGNTGSGKTTIFDAISFALFQSAANEGRRTEEFRCQYTKDNTKTYVDLIFEVNGKTYKIHREPKQIISGKEKSATAILTLPNNVVIEKIKLVEEKIEEILHLNARQFKQIVMLAQGEFSRLLFSDSKEREVIFRAVFGTSNIKRFIDNLETKRKNKENEKDIFENEILTTIKSFINIDNIEIPSFDNLATNCDCFLQFIDSYIRKEEITYIELDKKIELQKQEKDKLISNINIANHNNELLVELNNNLEKLKQLENSFVNISKLKSEVEKIELSLKYSDSYYNVELKKRELSVENDNLCNYNNKLDKKKKELLNIDEKESLLKNKISILETQFNSNNYQSLSDNIKMFFEYDQSIESEKQYIEDIENLNNSYNISRQSISFLKEKLCSLEKEYNELDEMLMKKDILSKELLKANDDKNNITRIQNLYERISNINKEKQEILNEFNKKKEKYDLLVKKLANMREVQLSEYASVIALSLQDGVPCPVCGSLEHPKKAKIMDGAVTSEMIKKQEEYNNIIYADLEESAKKIGSLETLHNEIEESLFVLSGKHFNQIVFVEEVNKCSDLSRLISKLSKQVDVLDNEILRVKNSKKEISDLRDKIESITKDINNLNINKTLINSKLDNCRKIISNVKPYIPQDYKNATELKERINLLINDIDSNKNDLELIENSKSGINGEINEIELSISNLNKKLIILEEECTKSLYEFIGSINNYFIDINEFTIFLNKKEQLSKKRKEIEDFNKDYIGLKSSIDALNEKTKNISFTDLKGLSTKLTEISTIIDNDVNNSAYLKTSINHNKINFKLLKKYLKEYHNVYRNYSEINRMTLIARGFNKDRISFERFILSKYFEQVVDFANIRLKELSNGHFEFVRREDVYGLSQQGLDIDIFDNFTGKSRSVKSLSGGEQFKASLSLALGLSDVVQQSIGGISIDTLFIDEGFGTLDSESLDSAINTIYDVEKKGKIIGVISHVSELKDRINCKICIKSTKNGSEIDKIVY